MTLIPHIRQPDCNVISSLRRKKGLSSFFFFFLFKHISNCLPQKHLGLSRGLTII